MLLGLRLVVHRRLMLLPVRLVVRESAVVVVQRLPQRRLWRQESSQRSRHAT